MPYKDLPEGQTHSENDGCGEPEHNVTTPEDINQILFDVDENDHRAIFPMKFVGGVTYIIIAKERIKMFETDSTYVLEVTPKE